MEERMINNLKIPLPLISYRVKIYANGVARISVKMVTTVVTLKLFKGY